MMTQPKLTKQGLFLMEQMIDQLVKINISPLQSLTALVTKLNHHPPEVIRSCLSLMKSAVKSENRAAATELIVSLRSYLESGLRCRKGNILFNTIFDSKLIHD